MTAQDARSEIARLITALLQIGLAVASNPPVIYQVGTIRRVLWSSAPRIAIGVPPTPFGTVADYRRLLDQGQYNLVLFDGALLMAIIEFRRDELIKQSLTYYPCPVDLPPQGDLFPQSIGELVDDALFGSLETMEWLATLGGNPTALGAAPRGYSLRMRAPLRFDFDLEAEAPLHPASHLHLGDAECRIPVYAPISFANFLRFVFRNYYTETWLESPFLQTLPVRPWEMYFRGT